MIVAVAAIVVGATTAFFSDTETSTGNTFTAGSIDLKIDNESYVTNNAGDLVASPNTSWDLRDLTIERFFNFTDLKPGDIGEDTISIHVYDNDSWVCMSAAITATPENGITEPEAADDSTVGANQGELQDELNFVFWADDGDNVLEADEANEVFEGTIKDFEDTSPRIVADSNWNIFTSEPGTPLTGGQDYYIGKAWCFGDLTLTPASQDYPDNVGPLTRGTTGISCDGTLVDNSTQSDGVVGDISFTAVQSRNNDNFSCSPPQ